MILEASSTLPLKVTLSLSLSLSLKFDIKIKNPKFYQLKKKVDSTTIQKSLNEMKRAINNVELDLKSLKLKSDKNDPFILKMDEFIKDAQCRYETIDLMFKKMIESYKELYEFFAFDSTNYTIGNFFEDLKSFCSQFKQCGVENARYKETHDKIKRAEADKAQRESAKVARDTRKEMLMQSTKNGQDMGVMDNLLEALQSGKLFESNNSSSLANRPRRVPRGDNRKGGNTFIL
jgi:diaphanous 2